LNVARRGKRKKFSHGDTGSTGEELKREEEKKRSGSLVTSRRENTRADTDGH
jgi:hypothetical protein